MIEVNLVWLNRHNPRMRKGIVTQDNYIKVRLKLQAVVNEIIQILKDYKVAGLINDIHFAYCKQKDMTPNVKALVRAKIIAKQSIKTIKSFFPKL